MSFFFWVGFTFFFVLDDFFFTVKRLLGDTGDNKKGYDFCAFDSCWSAEAGGSSFGTNT
jgi:hypothetical protein